MKRNHLFALAGAFALIMGLSGVANAQQTVAGSQSGAQAGAISAPTFVFEGAPDRQSINSRITSAPSMTAPNVFSSNPCVISASAAGSGMGFGFAIGAGIEDRDCTRRAHAALLAQMGLPRAAAEVLCNNAEVRAAMAVSGVPCAADRAQGTIMPNPPQPPGANFTGTATPVAATSQPVVASTPTGPVPASRARPDWCLTANAAERARSGGAC